MAESWSTGLLGCWTGEKERGGNGGGLERQSLSGHDLNTGRG